MNLIAVIFWGVIGVSLRYLFLVIVPESNFPWAVFFVNLLGSFAAGFVYASGMLQVSSVFLSPQVLLVGLMGGLTTFSAITLDTMRLIAESNYVLAFMNLIMNNLLGLGACFLGLRFAQSF